MKSLSLTLSPSFSLLKKRSHSYSSTLERYRCYHSVVLRSLRRPALCEKFDNMKCSPSRLSVWSLYCSSIALYSSTAVAGMPFRARNSKQEEGENNNNNNDNNNKSYDRKNATPIEAAISYEGNDIIVIPPKQNLRNPTVEHFFADKTATSAIEHNEVSEALKKEIRAQAQNMTDFLVTTRRTLHQRPELMYQERETSAVVQKLLAQMGIDFSTGWSVNRYPDDFPGPGGYGVVADIGTGGEPCVLLRADMDALPILERTEHIDAYKSQNDGKMHACGHDGHTTMLLGAASILKSMEDSIPGTVRLMFQPAEEGGAGGKRMREEGVLSQYPKPSHAFGMHVWPLFPSGTVAGRSGPLLAACERFEVLISGVGGHAAMPHLTIDPIVAAASIVMNLQTIVSRTLNPLESGVCSITKIEAGEAFNIIPASTLLRGTIRALSTETLIALRDRVQHIVESTAKVHGCNVTITYSPDYYPPTVNDPELYESFSKEVGALVSDEGQVRYTEPTMGAEDFSFVAESIPSTFFLLGQGSGNVPPTNYGLHHPHFALDENVLPKGVELHVNLALRALKKLGAEPLAEA